MIRNHEVVRKNSVCPICKSRERHRLAFDYMTATLDPKVQYRILHVAPEYSLVHFFQSRFPSSPYTSIDLAVGKAGIQANLEALPFEEASFDLLFCSHVLEHVENDRLAIAEMFRVLSPGGVAYVMVPTFPGATVEAADISDPAERMQLFDIPSHLRNYGADFPDRLAASGFFVELRNPIASYSKEDAERLGISKHIIFECSKPKPFAP